MADKLAYDLRCISEEKSLFFHLAAVRAGWSLPSNRLDKTGLQVSAFCLPWERIQTECQKCKSPEGGAASCLLFPDTGRALILIIRKDQERCLPLLMQEKMNNCIRCIFVSPFWQMDH